MPRTPPGSRLPVALEAAQLTIDPIGTLLRRARRYGDAFTLAIAPAGRVVVVSEPTAVRQALTGRRAVFHAGEASGRMLPFLAAHSVLRADEDAHARQRARLAPAFRHRSVAAHAGWIAEIAERELSSLPAGVPLALTPRLREIAFAVIARVVLGWDDEARVRELHARLRRMLGTPLALSLWLPGRREGGPRALRSVVARRRAEVDAVLRAEIRRRRAAPRGGGDVLALLLSARDEHGLPLPEQQICEELRALLVVGHETTATAAAWGVELLLHDRHVATGVARAVAEGDDLYPDAVVAEALRLRPPVIDVVRLLTTSVDLAGWPLPAGTIVMVAPLIMHHRPDLYPDPRAFRPERFLHAKPPAGAWIPFGGGRRRCLGAALAQLELGTVLRALYARWDIAPARPGRSRRAHLAGTTITPAGGVPVVLTPRESS